MGGKTRNIAIQLVLQQCCKTSCTSFGSPFFRTFTFGCHELNSLWINPGCKKLVILTGKDVHTIDREYSVGKLKERRKEKVHRVLTLRLINSILENGNRFRINEQKLNIRMPCIYFLDPICAFDPHCQMSININAR